MSGEQRYQQQHAQPQGSQQNAQQQHAQQQQLYMSPQTENLQQMYMLVDKLSSQLQENKRHKQNLLLNIDTLSRQANKELLKRNQISGHNSKIAGSTNVHSTDNQTDIKLFHKFLETRNITSERASPDSSPKHSTNTNNGQDKGQDQLVELRAQNIQLKKTLKDKTLLNKETFSLLEIHEEGLTTIIAMLRDDVYNYYLEFTKRARMRLLNETVPKEDAEFQLYLENITDIQKLMDISALYRLLLRLLDS